MERTTWESVDFRKTVEEMVATDPRFVGLAEYMVHIRLCWSYSIETACAGHGFIFFSPDWWDTLPEETRKTVIVHEVWHLILRHLERRDELGLDPYIYNLAADHVINLAIEADGFTFVGWNAYKDKKYRGKSSEEVYDILVKERDLKLDLEGHISGSEIMELIKEMIQNSDDDETLDDAIENNRLNVDSFMDSPPGLNPGMAGLLLDYTKRTVVIMDATYEDVFKKYMTDPLTVGKRSFMRPNRRTHGRGGSRFTLPGRAKKRGKPNRLKHLVYALDVSGSIGQRQAQQFQDSAHTIKRLMNPEKMTIILWDTRIVYERTFTDKEPYSEIKVRAGGGTQLEPVYARVAELDPEALVIFTDLAVAIPPEPKWDTIWFLTSKNDRKAVPGDLYGQVYLMPEMFK